MEDEARGLNRVPLVASGLLLDHSSGEAANNSAKFTEWLLSPELNLVKKVVKTGKETTSQEAGAYLEALHQAATNLIRARYEYEEEGEPFLKPQIDSFQFMSKQGGFTTTTQRSVLTEASEMFFHVSPPSSQEESRTRIGEEGSDSFEQQPKEAQLSPIDPSSSLDAHTLDPAPSMSVSLAPGMSVSLAPDMSVNSGHRIPKIPINGLYLAVVVVGL